MSHTPHELHDEFPEYEERIKNLKATNGHFARLMDQYHKVNREVHGAETTVTPVSEAAETNMRRERARLKDEIYQMLVG